MIWSAGTPAASRPSMIGDTTDARVPLFGPGAEKTLMPTTSCVETSARHASAGPVEPVRFVSAWLSMARTISGRGLKASVAFSSCTMTTREEGPDGGYGNGSAANKLGWMPRRTIATSADVRQKQLAIAL